jgi:hypothetical protein
MKKNRLHLFKLELECQLKQSMECTLLVFGMGKTQYREIDESCLCQFRTLNRRRQCPRYKAISLKRHQ